MMAQAITFEQVHGGDDVGSIMDDAMTAFLREMDELEALDVTLKACVDSPTAPEDPLELALTRLESESGSPPQTLQRPQRKRGHAVQTRKARHDGQVCALQSEIDALYDQLQEIHVAQQQKEARMKRLARANGNEMEMKNWKRQATHERLLKSHAQEENRRLRKRIAANETFSDTARRFVNRAKDCALVLPERLSFVLIDNDTRVYAMLKANLDTRSHYLGTDMNRRLTMITQQCVTATMQAKEPWFPIQRNAGVDFEESRILPFSAAIFNGSLARHTQFDSISGSRTDAGDQLRRFDEPMDSSSSFALDHSSGSREVEGRTIVRRIMNEHGTLLLWETMSYWQSDTAPHVTDQSPPKRAMVRSSGYAMIAPFKGYEATMSVAQCKIGIDIHSLDGSKMRKTDPLVRNIVSAFQRFHKAQAHVVENLVMDAAMLLQLTDDK